MQLHFIRAVRFTVFCMFVTLTINSFPILYFCHRISLSSRIYWWIGYWKPWSWVSALIGPFLSRGSRLQLFGGSWQPICCTITSTTLSYLVTFCKNWQIRYNLQVTDAMYLLKMSVYAMSNISKPFTPSLRSVDQDITPQGQRLANVVCTSLHFSSLEHKRKWGNALKGTTVNI